MRKVSTKLVCETRFWSVVVVDVCEIADALIDTGSRPYMSVCLYLPSCIEISVEKSSRIRPVEQGIAND